MSGNASFHTHTLAPLSHFENTSFRHLSTYGIRIPRVSQTHLAFCVTALLQYHMMMHRRLGESPSLDQNEPSTATTAVILGIFQKPSSALKFNAMAHCALAACRVMRVPMTNLAEILNSRPQSCGGPPPARRGAPVQTFQSLRHHQCRQLPREYR